jgi:hypothetical protein
VIDMRDDGKVTDILHLRAGLLGQTSDYTGRRW